VRAVPGNRTTTESDDGEGRATWPGDDDARARATERDDDGGTTTERDDGEENARSRWRRTMGRAETTPRGMMI
jgi:hypothetical protein